MSVSMEGMAAIVTGGGTGIGAAVVRRLAERGVRCAINYASSRDAAEALAAEIGNGSIAVKADIADDAQCRALAAAALEAFGRIDLLVNNSGKTKFANHEDLEALSADDFLDIYRLNAVAPFQMIRACASAMREGPASAVVNIASVAGVFGNGSSVAYAASKGALATMTKSLARVLAPAIRVNAVAPGYVGTGWFSERMTREAFEAFEQFIASQTPMQMAAHAEDIAGPVVNLLDPASRVITGETVLLDAGAHLDVGLSRRPGKG
ncbi:SDR family NAD(P)-dependent oxidoreductase [Sphingomonas koreensis]|uniref:SDR family NAD(P)-dependent oxidoreductase n=1 Tax=Sphingomonas koreensis TaxID=93064 RepID=A0A430G6W8_9SPHN|nr:SDR family oxidoreductase [Sphingomonas koreensis]RSY88662.1 SDR family NAD(P)-dependent oxidoreductase [Sphingomonas koreensis]